MLKKILPVGIAIVLIVLIAVVVTAIKKGNDRTPKLKNADEVYASYEDLKVTYDRLYTHMKNAYGTTELLNMVDEKLYADKISAIDDNDEDFVNYVKDQVFKTHDLDDMSEDEKADAQEAWSDIIMSLQLTNLITEVDSEDYTVETSNVWKKVKEYYKLPYAREQWAKEEYWKRYLEAREDNLPFDMTKAENATSSIETYFLENYTGSVIGLFIPFSSATAAKAMMEKHGINIDSNVLSANDGWVKASYDYYSKAKVEEDDFLTYAEVVQAFFAMYNEVYAYLNDGNAIITDASYTTQRLDIQTAYLIADAVKEAFKEDEYGMSVTLPTTVEVTDGSSATISWGITNSEYGSINDDGNVVSAKFDRVDTSETQVSLTLPFIVKYNEETINSSIKIILACDVNEETGERTSKEGAVTLVECDDVEPFEGIVLNEDMYSEEFLASCDNLFRFSWTKAEATNVNATLAEYLATDSTKLTIEDNPTDLFKSYTVEPVAVGDYYFLILKLADVEQTELFQKDANGTNEKDSDGNYIIADQALYDEIVEAKKQEMLTENAINEMVYTNRYEHGLKIYDSYIEAIYEYDYKTFFETTIQANTYNNYQKTKKNKKALVAEFKVNDKKEEISVDDLFARLEDKYAKSTLAALIENYILVSNEKYNSIYNPFTNKVLDKTSYKNLMTAEISTLKQNFEADYFTYSYLSYYGFTPNFSSKYGWQKFIKDYFVAFSDQELLTVTNYGGTIYSDALTAFTDDVCDVDKIMTEIDKAYDDWFSTSVINLLITIDRDYNADSSSSDSATIIMEEKDNWTDEQIELAKELCTFMFEVASQTNADSLAEQLTALKTLYNEAAYEYDAAAWSDAKAHGVSIYDFNYFGKYKLAGLKVTFENAASYDSSSSIMKEFADVCRELYKKADELGLTGTTFDVPLVCDEPFFTDYGMHYIAALSSTEATDKPTRDEVRLYRAKTLLDAAEKDVTTAQENIDKYKESGYNTSSYEAQKALAEAKVAKYKAEWLALLAELNLAEDYEIPSEVSTKITAWYTNAESTVEKGTYVTREYIRLMNESLSKLNAKVTNEAYKAFLDLLVEACDDADEE